MTKLMQYLVAAGLVCTLVSPAFAAKQKKETAHAAQASTHSSAKQPAVDRKGKTSKASPAKKVMAEAKPRTAKSGQGKSAGEKASTSKVGSGDKADKGNCKTVRTRHGKRQRVCGAASPAAPVEPALQSPIRENALNGTPQTDKGTEIKARTAPDRAYAVDGETFFYQGRKYRVAGLGGAGGSDMAKQRLQKALEGGAIAVDPVSTDEAGVATANVRINGRDLRDQLQ